MPYEVVRDSSLENSKQNYCSWICLKTATLPVLSDLITNFPQELNFEAKSSKF